MFENLNHPYPFNNNFKHNVKTIGLVGMGFMMFLLYFQPFGINFLQSEHDAYFALGAGILSAGTLFANSIFLPGIMPSVFDPSRWTIRKEMIWNIWLFIDLFVILSLMAWFVNRIHFADIPIFRTGALALLPLVLFNLISYNHSLKQTMVQVLDNGRRHWFREEKSERVEEVKPLNIIAENGKDVFSVILKDILVFHSSGNYIEIYWIDNQVRRKKLIRQTFAYIEQLIKDSTEFQKTHRCWIVNLKMADELMGNSKGYFVEINHLGFNVPVSRNFIPVFKELLSHKKTALS